MTAPIFIQNDSRFAGLGASEVNFSDDEGLTITAKVPTTRQEVTESEWIQNTNAQWEAANPQGAAALQKKHSIPMLVGAAALLAGGIAMASGKAKLGIPLTLLGAGGVVAGLLMRKLDYGTLNGASIAIEPGWHRSALNGNPDVPSFFRGLQGLNGANVFVENR